MPQSSFELQLIASLSRGNTGSIPVRDAKFLFSLALSGKYLKGTQIE
jgi:hypothetical protein